MWAFRQFFSNFWRFFPVQLLILNVKKHLFLTILWLILFLSVTNRLFSGYGIPLLFLDPEYLDEAGFLSYGMMGLGIGGFIITWSLVIYMLNSFRFEFLASLRWPFTTFFLNNSIIPIGFIITHSISIYYFQINNEYLHKGDIIVSILGYLAGVSIVILLGLGFFQFANTDLLRLIKRNPKGMRLLKRSYFKRRDQRFEDLRSEEIPFPVQFYISIKGYIKRCRSVDHYEPSVLDAVFKQHHWNAILVQSFSIVVLVTLGVFIEIPFFQFPAAMSVFVGLAVIASAYGLFFFWTGKWAGTAFVILFLLMNQATKYNIFNHESKVIGMDYSKSPRSYDYASLEKVANEFDVNADKKNIEKILQNWKRKNSDKQKPPIYFICSGGGGVRATLFTSAIVQKIDSLTNGELMKRTFLMTGASGGTLGLALYREMYYREQLHEKISRYDKSFVNGSGKDLINPICASIVTNDLFFPWRTLKIGNNRYRKDRGYMFEQQFIKNTGNILTRSLRDYIEPEKKAMIPLLINYPVITNDARFLLIASQPMRFMMTPVRFNEGGLPTDIDAIDFQTFFSGYKPLDVELMTALRMNASFPYVLPNVTLPTEPVFTVIDAGIRDNFGIFVITRFMLNFEKWIKENTSGVYLIEIRSINKENVIKPEDKRSMLSKLFSPFGTLTGNIADMHDYQNGQTLSIMEERFGEHFHLLRLEYVPSKKNAKASMSLRLTNQEKDDVLRAIDAPSNVRSINKIVSSVK